MESAKKKEDIQIETARAVPRSFSQIRLDEKELEEIFARTYGPVKRERNAFQKTVRSVSFDYFFRKKRRKEEKRKKKSICWWTATTLFLHGKI